MTNQIQPTESPTDPCIDIDSALEAMRRRFAESLGIVPFGSFEPEAALRPPRMDVTDTGPSYRVVAEVPGIPKEKLDIRVRGAQVEIRGENGSETEQKEKHYLRRERTYSGYYRALELPEPVVSTEVRAKVVDGLLELELPKQHPTPSEEEVKVSVS